MSFLADSKAGMTVESVGRSPRGRRRRPGGRAGFAPLGGRRTGSSISGRAALNPRLASIRAMAFHALGWRESRHGFSRMNYNNYELITKFVSWRAEILYDRDYTSL